MSRIALLTLGLIVLAGCNDRDSTDVKLNAAVAFTSAREAVSTAWSSVSMEAAKLTASSSRAALEEAKKQASNLQSQLSKIEIKNPIDQAQLDAAQNQLEKIQAAMNVQDFRKQSEEAVNSAIATGQIAKLKYDEASQKLVEMDATYKDLQTKLAQAQSTYDAASATLSASINRVKQLGGG
jgi:chromosome segregation ATPase